MIGYYNNNNLVFEIFYIAHQKHPDAEHIFHSNQGYQYMIQSISPVSRCIDNGSMEAFWGMLKSETHYLKKFNSYNELCKAIVDYIYYYNNQRYLKRLNCMSPLRYRRY